MLTCLACLPAACQVVIGARATKVNIEKGSSGARTTGVEYAMQQFGDRFTGEQGAWG